MPSVKVELGGRELNLDSYLLEKLDMVKKLQKKNWDCVIVVDGMERSGKSTIAQIIGWYLSEGKITINNIAIDSADAVWKLENLPDKSILIIDEGSLMFSSKDVMKKENKRLEKILKVVGQKNLILIVVLPSFFELAKYIAVERSRFLIHCYTSGDFQRGRYAYFSQKRKRILYQEGKKNFSSYKKPRANFIGRFADFTPFGEEYLETKRKTLMSTLKEEARLDRPLDKSGYKTELMLSFKKNCPDIPNRLIAKGFGISLRELYRRFQVKEGNEG